MMRTSEDVKKVRSKRRELGRKGGKGGGKGGWEGRGKEGKEEGRILPEASRMCSNQGLTVN